MAVARIRTGTVNGIDGVEVIVEADTTSSIPQFNIVGLPDATVNEAKERVKAAIKNAGFAFPLKRVTINLAPADVRKVGSSFDLPMAIGVLHTSEYFPEAKQFEDTCFVGELSLDGSIRGVKGILAITLMAKSKNMKAIVVPIENVAEASLVEGITVYGLEHLSQLPMFLDHPEPYQSRYTFEELRKQVSKEKNYSRINFNEIKGQTHAKRALEIAAAGGHNIAMFGPPGSGKSMLAKAFMGILPPMDFDEMLEVSRIYSVSGLLTEKDVLMAHRPFRSPHHSASMAGITGGGSHPKPGEITLAHRGVLFLDEFTEFPRAALEVLRQPLEDGVVTVSRVQQSMTFPAQFILLAAMNPCPCGYYGDTIKQCSCSPNQIQRYLSRVSGPIMDRIDLQLEVPRLTEEELIQKNNGTAPQCESSEVIAQRVAQARERQKNRLIEFGIRTNSEMLPSHLKKFCTLDAETEILMTQAAKRFHLSGRAFDRLLKLARTIADLAGSENVLAQHLAEALQYRGFDKLSPSKPVQYTAEAVH